MQDKRQSVLNYIKFLNAEGRNDITVQVNRHVIDGVQKLLKTNI